MGARKLRFAAIAAILFLFSVPALGGKPGSVSEVIVVSTIEGGSVLADPAIPNFRLQSDLLGDYHNGVDRVLSRLQAGTIGTGAGDWELDTADSAVRKLTLDCASLMTAMPIRRLPTRPCRRESLSSATW
jgi:hypothetical protein